MTVKHLDSYEAVRRHAREIAVLTSASGVLEWDERTYMPGQASEYRAEQLSQLAGLIHARWTDQRFGDQLRELSKSDLAADRASDAGATIHELLRQYDRRTRLPRKLVEELAGIAVVGQHHWLEARAESDFDRLAPTLSRIVELKREEADALRDGGLRYDALLDDFEPGARSSEVAAVFAALGRELVPLVQAIAVSPRQPDASLLFRHYPVEKQEAFARQAVERIGFDFARGRLDTTAHPFCSQLGPHDCRLTTRYNPHDFSDAFFGTLHEAGHGLYDQGLRVDEYGLPLGEAASLGIHESQSRLWENLVGRSEAFWHHFYPQARKTFAALDEVEPGDFYFAVNNARPSLIRTESDEVTYNLHIFIRFALEQALIAGDLKVGDLPGAWNEQYRRQLGIEPTSDATGVLQDIHWSAGAIGYFPTYTLGNLYAAQFFEQAEADIGPLDEQFRRAEFAPLLGWLREKIHRPGRRFRAADLVVRVTGQPLSHEPLVRHLRRKFAPLYRLK